MTIATPTQVLFCIHESLLGIEVPHGVLGDIWSSKECMRATLPERRHEVVVPYLSERPYRSDATKSLALLSSGDTKNGPGATCQSDHPRSLPNPRATCWSDHPKSLRVVYLVELMIN
ncbi:hypothetical protein IGI04_015066 [Brassica rapa subsp. trilocularis]|uniref:Uncharacterized protein n=1 Tax=Brassica rapa subsp. trilocularis TaxID=1813537 RepID=A0ABQ7MNZ4_BRACM|nr:hypothetical protein IGI04_015066 [Brassica rapa subsp. trilocularis]